MKASEQVRYYANADGPAIGTVSRKVIEKDGLYFKDLDGSGQFRPYDDWRLRPEERAAAYAKVLTVKEKIALLFASSWRMGRYPSGEPGAASSRPALLDESGLLDESEIVEKSIFGEQKLPGTTDLIQNWFARRLILRANPSPDALADWINQLQAVAEQCARLVPVQVISNSRNENGQVVFGMNDASGVFAAWPGTLGIAAAVMGSGVDLIDRFAGCVRREWDAVGLKKGYMYMADVVTDPRWQRSYGTFGEDPALIREIFSRLIPGIQGSAKGVTPEGVAMTVKHFPGGGPRENGFDPHYAAGQWNVYATPGSLRKYHLPPFLTAAEYHASSVMPYYSKPSADKSAPQEDLSGRPLPLAPYGFAYNRFFLEDVLRGQMGFRGYINSDTGIIHNMCWGVERLDKPERIAFAVTRAGVDLIGGLFDNELGQEAYDRGKNGYYETHPVPDGFSPEDLVLTDEALDRAVTRTLTEMFQCGLFENPYRDPRRALAVVSDPADWEEAARVHRQSVVLLKNDGTLPLSAAAREGKKLYAEAFCQKPEAAQAAAQALRAALFDYVLVDDPAQADYAILLLTPSSGEYFSATRGYLELDVCENKTVRNVTPEGRPDVSTHQETTLSGASRIPKIAEAVHARGGKVIINVNVSLAWQLGGVEPFADALTAGFDTFPSATLDVIFGRFSPVGRLPLTLPRGDDVLAVDGEGVCVSPNDVPGFDKDRYMPDALKDENGKAYAYRDQAGHYYELGFGLSYAET